MYSSEKFKELSEKYGQIASWAIWNYSNPKDSRIIEKYIDQLNSRYVLIALNVSRDINKWPVWSNFHDNTHARKLKYACNDTELRGSYMTDLFKNVVKPRSTNIEKVLNKKKINENVDFFRQEMEDIGIDQNSQFIIFGVRGSTISRLYDQHFRKYFKNKVINSYHYSYFTKTDKEWVEKFWEETKINHDYDLILSKYKNS